MPRSDAETRLVRLKWRRAFDRWRGQAALLVIAVKGAFDPNQPRGSAGNPDGGQWTGGGDGTGGRSRSGTSRRDRADDRQRTGTDLFRNPDKPRVNLAQGRGRGRGGRVPVRVGNRLQFVTPEEKIELVSAKGQAKRAVERVKELEPDWEPLKGKVRSSIRGAIDEAYDIRYQS